MKILFHCWEYPPRGSGIGRYIFHMSKALREAGHFTVVLTSHGDEGPSEEKVENGFVFRLYGVQDIGTSLTASLVLKKADEYNMDWIEGVDHLGESAQILFEKQRPPVVIKTHYNDVVKVARYSQAFYFWQRFLIDLACLRDRKRIARERRSLSHADLLLTPSRRILIEMQGQGLALAPLQNLVPNPIPPLTNWVNNEAATPTLLLVGRVDIGKGIEYLPTMVENLASQFPDLRVEIAGGDSYARFLGSTKDWLVQKMGDRKETIKILGNLGQDALDDAYSRAWVVIVPSKWDTFPTVVLEAMVRRKAIVASFNGGMPEMLSKTLCSLADPARPEFSQAVARFLFDKELRDTAGLSAQVRAEKKYRPERVVDNYINLLQSFT